jgi:hypothetical protein
MLIKSCFHCNFHEIKQEENEQMSHCQKENCWSRFSKCIANKALDRFLDQETSVRETGRARERKSASA